ncbi:hypothetical protein PTSG_08565 [Salpingoeca rosetta]|uniref:RRM domain-containing protein n=1 Tax=Salpingoeca rosetta (strain ATCC 50818 / BSB-021) TaxID=946362 RepID=F2UK21_SALR5|nr:uncharacterized protein PTSG_08565 [Salpingoeca rosetta]EGD77470.1 hypothetical protein PTSG_08565 [Salpingoeca rosetta]|eukprot:XP_004990358.1 hypothetical protein PTSG_08565 [Salpingoeca rosetta]
MSGSEQEDVGLGGEQPRKVAKVQAEGGEDETTKKVEAVGSVGEGKEGPAADTQGEKNGEEDADEDEAARKERQRKRQAERMARNAELAQQAILQAQQLAARQAQASAQQSASSASMTATAPQLAVKRAPAAAAAAADTSSSSSSSSSQQQDDAGDSDEFFIPDPKKNPHVYVTGLPLDTDEVEFYEFMKKCGVMAEDEEGAPKIQLYRDENGNVKGDGKCTYLRVESVTLALQLLDGTDYRDGNIVHLERAKFRKRDIERKKKMQKEKDGSDSKGGGKKAKVNKKTLSHKLLGWHDTDLKRKKAVGVLILRHMFHPSEFTEDPMLLVELKRDIEKECKKFGPIKKLEIFDRNPEGVVMVRYQDEAALGPAIATLNGRWFGGQQIVAEPWDGREKFKVEETEEEKEQRLKQWEEYLGKE